MDQVRDATDPLTVSVALPALLVVILVVASGHVLSITPERDSKIVVDPVVCACLQSTVPLAEADTPRVITAAVETRPSIFKYFMVFSPCSAPGRARLYRSWPTTAGEYGQGLLCDAGESLARQRLDQRGSVVGAVEAAAVDEEGGRAGGAARLRGGHVAGDALAVSAGVEVGVDPVGVEAEVPPHRQHRLA